MVNVGKRKVKRTKSFLDSPAQAFDGVCRDPNAIRRGRLRLGLRALSTEETPAVPSPVELGRYGTQLLRLGRGRDRPRPEALRLRRAGDHRRQPHLSGTLQTVS